MGERERGDTLVELVVALGILGTAVVTIIGGFLNLATSTSLQKDQARMISTLVSASEYAKTRACGVSCAAEPSVPSSTLAGAGTAQVSISGPSTAACCGTPLVQYVITVTSGASTFSNIVVIRP